MENRLVLHHHAKHAIMNFRKLLFLALSGISLSGLAQTDKNVDSRITDVTVFLSKAQVTRTVQTRLDAGKINLVLAGLTSQLDPQSIQVKGKGNIVILGTSHRQNYLTDVNTPRALKILRDSVEYLQRQIILEQSQKEILNKEEQMLLSNQKIGGTNQNLTVAELKTMADFYRMRLGDIVSSRMKEDEKIKQFSAKLTRIQMQINSQNELYRRNTSEIVINISVNATTTADLEVSYVVNNAGWYPVYDLRATNTKSPVQLSYKANVFQSTGEAWKNVHLKLSTANPNLGGLKPELYAWYLDFYQPIRPVAYKSKAMRSAPVAEDMKADKMEEKRELDEVAVVSSSEFVSTVQTSLNTEFDISLPYHVESSPQPTLVDIQNFEMKADYQYSVVPKLDMDAFLVAKATGWEEYNLLPGEANIFFEGTFVSKTFIDPNSVKDTLTISLGRDKRIVVKREKVKDYTTRKTFGSNIRETHGYEISVRNTKAEPVKIVVEDQVPLTQNNQIEVLVTDTGGANYNKDTGKLIWTWNIASGETKKSTFKFEVKYPKDKPINGL